MELAPSSSPVNVIGDDLPETKPTDEASESAPGDHVRVRVLETLPEPIMDESGEALVLEAGDVHMLEEATASWLIDAGVAERADL